MTLFRAPTAPYRAIGNMLISHNFHALPRLPAAPIYIIYIYPPFGGRNKYYIYLRERSLKPQAFMRVLKFDVRREKRKKSDGIIPRWRQRFFCSMGSR